MTAVMSASFSPHSGVFLHSDQWWWLNAAQLVDPVQNGHVLLPPLQPSWLSITFSLPFSTNLPGGLIVSGEAKQKQTLLLQSLRALPPPHRHQHTRPPWITTPTSPRLPPQPGLQGFPLFHPVCWRTSGITSHIALAPSRLPWTVSGGGEGHALAPAQFSTTLPSAPAVVGPRYLWHLLHHN